MTPARRYPGLAPQPLDYVPLPPSGRIYKPRKTLRRAMRASFVAAMVTVFIAFLPVAAVAMVVLGGVWALFCWQATVWQWPDLEDGA